MELVERETAVELLNGLLKDAVRGCGRLVVVSGEAGIGKTALVTAFLDGCDDRVRILAGACDPVVTPRPLGPLVDIASAVGGDLATLLKSGSGTGPVFEALLRASGSGPGQQDGIFVKRATGGGSAHPPAAAQTGVLGDGDGAPGRAAGEESPDLIGEASLEVRVDGGASDFVPLAPEVPGVCVGHALLLGKRERRFLDKDTLSLVPLPAATPSHDHRRQAASFRSAPRESSVARRKIDEMIKVRAGKAQRARVMHPEQVASAAALGAGPVSDRLDDHYAGGPLGLRHIASPSATGTAR